MSAIVATSAKPKASVYFSPEPTMSGLTVAETRYRALYLHLSPGWKQQCVEPSAPVPSSTSPDALRAR